MRNDTFSKQKLFFATIIIYKDKATQFQANMMQREEFDI